MKFPTERQYPKTIKVRNTHYKIKFVNQIGKDKLTVGLCTSDPPTITLRRRGNRQKVFETMCHELLHAIEFEHRAKVKHKLIYLFAKAITKIIRDNFV